MYYENESEIRKYSDKMNSLFLIVLLFGVPTERKKPETLKPKTIPSRITRNNICVKETNPCGTEINNGTQKCCPGLQCYEETACISSGMYKILKHYNITFGNCYNKTLLHKIINTNYTKSNNTKKIKIVKN